MPKGVKGFQKGHHGFMTPEIAMKISLTQLAIGSKPPDRTGCRRIFTKKHRLNMSRACVGKKLSKEHKEHIGLALKGSKCHWWKGGITPLSKMIREMERYSEWVSDILKRDAYRCQKCFRGGKLHVHHTKKSFSLLYRKFLCFYSQFSPFEDKETLFRLAETYKPFWDVSNGTSVCIKCHQGMHDGMKIRSY